MMVASENADMDTESADDEAAPTSAAAASPSLGETSDVPAEAGPTQASRHRREQLIARDSGLLLVTASPGAGPAGRIFRPIFYGGSKEAMPFPTTLRNRITLCWSGIPHTAPAPSHTLLGHRGDRLRQLRTPSEERSAMLQAAEENIRQALGTNPRGEGQHRRRNI